MCMNGGIDIYSWYSNGIMQGEPGCQCKGGFTGKYCQNSFAGDNGGVYRRPALTSLLDNKQELFIFPSKLDNSPEKL